WGLGIGIVGILTAILAPVLGAIADRAGGRMVFIGFFSVLYVPGAWGVWYAAPGAPNLFLVMVSFGIGLAAMEFATIFTNAMLPDLGTKSELGRISGSGWAFGYVGGLISLILMLVLFAEQATTGRTMIGIEPLFGLALDPAAREGTRAVGPFTAIWYAVFMIPFFLWVRDVPREHRLTASEAVRRALPELKQSLLRLPKHKSLFRYLIASMLYRDALNGIYVFGGIYASGVLGWSVVQIGIFGILTVISGAVFAWLGGLADSRFGPKPVILVTVGLLALVCWAVTMVSRGAVFGMTVAETSALPDIVFYVIGMLIGAAGGALQSASRTMLVRQADPRRMTEAFGLFALTGKATSFIAPLAIAGATWATGSQQAGIVPLIFLFLIGFVVMLRVGADGDHATAPQTAAEARSEA
ncbi:MAG TPA: MFS transporter, partial [Paenirhodobacter sp.]